MASSEIRTITAMALTLLAATAGCGQARYIGDGEEQAASEGGGGGKHNSSSSSLGGANVGGSSSASSSGVANVGGGSSVTSSTGGTSSDSNMKPCAELQGEYYVAPHEAVVLFDGKIGDETPMNPIGITLSETGTTCRATLRFAWSKQSCEIPLSQSAEALHATPEAGSNCRLECDGTKAGTSRADYQISEFALSKEAAPKLTFTLQGDVWIGDVGAKLTKRCHGDLLAGSLPVQALPDHTYSDTRNYCDTVPLATKAVSVAPWGMSGIELNQAKPDWHTQLAAELNGQPFELQWKSPAEDKGIEQMQISHSHWLDVNGKTLRIRDLSGWGLDVSYEFLDVPLEDSYVGDGLRKLATSGRDVVVREDAGETYLEISANGPCVQAGSFAAGRLRTAGKQKVRLVASNLGEKPESLLLDAKAYDLAGNLLEPVQTDSGLEWNTNGQAEVGVELGRHGNCFTTMLPASRIDSLTVE